MSYGASGSVVARLIDRVLVVEIDREDQGNSIDRATGQALLDVFSKAGTDPEVSAVVLQSVGDRFFCTGGDIKEYSGLDREALAEQFERMSAVCRLIEGSEVPVIAAMEGAALGGGVEVALACDIRVASPGSWIQFPNVGLGVITAWGGGQRLATAVGRSRALEIMLSRRRVEAIESERIGLVDRVVDDPAGSAAGLAADLARLPREVVVAAKAHLAPGDDADERSAKAMLDLWFEHGSIRASGEAP
jgi:enoyl-CoA hydratase/carnithine racemase